VAANRKVRAAAVQLAPSLSSRAATTDKVCAAIEAAAREGAELVVFPETVGIASNVTCPAPTSRRCPPVCYRL